MMPDGWQFWGRENGRIRKFVVAESDRDAALQYLKDRLPGVKFLNEQLIPGGVLQHIVVPPEKACEMRSLDPKDEVGLFGFPIKTD